MGNSYTRPRKLINGASHRDHKMGGALITRKVWARNAINHAKIENRGFLTPMQARNPRFLAGLSSTTGS